MIGGQAVNYWAERYLAQEPELRKPYAPFTSGDIDFRGNRDDVRHIAGQLELTAVFPDKVAMTALAGAIPFQIGKHPSNIEVVRLLPGVSLSTVDALAIGAELRGQQIFGVLDPISLVSCKVNLALTVSQENRQDVGHLKILIFCVRGFLSRCLAGGGTRPRVGQGLVGRGHARAGTAAAPRKNVSCSFGSSGSP